MNWESGFFCKLYKTKNYKFNSPKYFNLNDSAKISLYNNVNKQIKELYLNNPKLYGFNLNINVNKNCSLYNLSSNNKNYYFSYTMNFNFYLYYNLIIYGRKLLNPQNESEKDIIFKWEIYLFHLFFLKEINLDLLRKEIKTVLNEHFKYYCFILGQVSYFDIILLSIIIDIDLYDEILKKENEDIYQYFKRWIFSITKIYDIKSENIKSFYKSKEKDFLYNTYKMTSCPELVEAVKNSNYEEVENLLVNRHENVETRTPRYFKSLAHLACQNADKKMISILIKYGCNIHSLDFENMTPLYDAIYSNNIQFVDYLIKELKMNINHHEIQNRTPFYWACCTSNIDMIKYLLSYPEVDINSLSSMGRSALSKACWNGQVEVAKLLCSQPSMNTVNTPDINKRCPLHNAVWGEFGGREGKKVPNGQPSDSPECAELLIQNGAKINVKDIEGNTPLMIAGSTNGINSMKVLLKYNMNLNEENNNHETALIQSTKYGNYESILTLIDYYKNHLNDENNIDLDKGDINNYTPINYSIFYKKILCLKPFLENISKYNNKEKIIELINLCIQSHSKLCFFFLFRKFVNEYENKITDDEYLQILKMILIYENISFFNYIYDILKEEKIISLMNANNKELLLYLLILEIQTYKYYDIEKEKKNLNNSKIDKNKVLSEEEREKKYDEILKKKMANLTDEEIELFDENYEVQNHEDYDSDSSFEGALFLDIINNIFTKICKLELQKKELNINLLSYLIMHNKEELFLSLKTIYLEKKANFIPYKKINFDKNKYYIFKPEKHKLSTEKLFIDDEKDNGIWPRTINYLNQTNILFIIIEKQNKIYFNELINNEHISDYIYDIVPDTKKNIFHIIFENFDKNQFEKIFNLVETKYNNNKEVIKDKFLPLINQNDASLMTPLDVIINKIDDNTLNVIVKKINNFYKKYANNFKEIILKPIMYNITKFKINISKFELDSAYIKKISDDYIQCKKFIKQNNINKNDNNSKKGKETSSQILCTFDEEYSQSKYFINELCLNDTKKIIDLILENKIEEEFKIINPKYIHSFIDTEEKLIETRNEIIKESVLGIDAEFDGEKCEIDGVVCTIQISSLKKTYVIDTLKLHHLIKKYLGDIFESDNILKIFHGCDNDLFWILSNFEIKTSNIYDTSRSFVVYQELILNKTFKNGNFPSLYYLVVFFLGVKLNKRYQTSNWKIRPLTDAMYQYALNDAKSVLYLYYILQGLYAYLNKIDFNTNDKYNEFYYKIKILFFKDRENISICDTKYPEGYYRNILSKIKLLSLEMISNKIKIENNKINIEIEKVGE